MVSGSSKIAYWLGNYLGDIIFQALPAIVGIIGVHAFGLDLPEVEWLFTVMIFANPAFIYFLSFLFEKDDSGSLAIKLVYFVFGVIAPIAISILQVIDKTKDVAKILKWFFYVSPIYCLTYGFMSVAQRALIAFVLKEKDLPAVFSKDVAGPSLYFLLGAIPFFWFLVFLFENKVFDVSNYRRRGEPVNLTASQMRRSALEDDEDIVEEATRVANCKDPAQLTVKVDNVHKNFGAVRAVDGVSFGLEYGECFALLGVSGAGKTTCFKCLTGEIYPSKGDLRIMG